MKHTKEDIESATETLKKYVKKGATIHCIVRSVARSGMSRTMDLYAVHKGEMMLITWSVAVACGYTLTKDGLIKRHGCGMDMCSDTVYGLARLLFGTPYLLDNKGRSIGETLRTRTI